MADINEQAFFQGSDDNREDNSTSHTLAGDPLTPSERALNTTILILIGVGVLFFLAVIMGSNFAFDSRDATEFSMELTGFQGLNATTLGHTVSPRFSLRVRAVNRHIVVKPWCYSGGDAVVSYSDVALAWGHVPRFCIERKKVPVELTVIPWGREVGLSEDLRRRLASDWKMGGAEVKVDMMVYYDEKGVSSAVRKGGPVLKSFQVMLTGHEVHPD